MFNKLSLGQIWGLAFSLIAFDILLITLFFGAPAGEPNHDASNWDFRIAELRQLDKESESAVAGVSISRDEVDQKPESSPTPTPRPTVVPTFFQSVTKSETPTIKPWQMPFGNRHHGHNFYNPQAN